MQRPLRGHRAVVTSALLFIYFFLLYFVFPTQTVRSVSWWRLADDRRPRRLRSVVVFVTRFCMPHRTRTPYGDERTSSIILFGRFRHFSQSLCAASTAPFASRYRCRRRPLNSRRVRQQVSRASGKRFSERRERNKHACFVFFFFTRNAIVLFVDSVCVWGGGERKRINYTRAGFNLYYCLIRFRAQHLAVYSHPRSATQQKLVVHFFLVS